MKNKKIFKAMLSIIIILLSLFSIGYLAYSLTFYEGVETFYRIYAIVILIYFFLLLSYLELRSIKKKSMKSFLIPAFISIVFISAELYGSYYLKKIYKSMNYTDNTNIKSLDTNILIPILISNNLPNKETGIWSDVNPNDVPNKPFFILMGNHVYGPFLPQSRNDTVEVAPYYTAILGVPQNTISKLEWQHLEKNQFILVSNINNKRKCR